MSTNSAKILVVEDDKAISDLIRLNLEQEGFTVVTKSRGDQGLEALTSGSYDLSILDVVVPGLSGLDICKKAQTLQNRPRILMLTSKSDELDRILGLELGADDYVTKPFSIKELVARVKALLRRGSQVTQIKKLTLGKVEIDVETRRATLSGKELELTPTEFDLLFHLLSYPGRAFSREELLSSVWGYNYAGYEHTVNTHINRLRNKIEIDPENPEIIQTVWGVGYRCVDATIAK